MGFHSHQQATHKNTQSIQSELEHSAQIQLKNIETHEMNQQQPRGLGKTIRRMAAAVVKEFAVVVVRWPRTAVPSRPSAVPSRSAVRIAANTNTNTLRTHEERKHRGTQTEAYSDAECLRLSASWATESARSDTGRQLKMSLAGPADHRKTHRCTENHQTKQTR